MAKNADSDRHARGNVRRKWMHRDARMSDSVLPDHRIALKNPDLHFDRWSPTDHGSAHHSRWGLKRQPPGHFVDRVEPDSPLRIDHAYLFHVARRDGNAQERADPGRGKNLTAIGFRKSLPGQGEPLSRVVDDELNVPKGEETENAIDAQAQEGIVPSH